LPCLGAAGGGGFVFLRRPGLLFSSSARQGGTDATAIDTVESEVGRSRGWRPWFESDRLVRCLRELHRTALDVSRVRVDWLRWPE
jgi:hypothetical protein